VAEIMEFYFQACSIEVNCEILSRMAATLANDGACPSSGAKCIDRASIGPILDMLKSCGMNDYSTQWKTELGFAAKSSISGALLVVIPKLLGLAIYSPPLDAFKNSIKGLAFCKVLKEKFSLDSYLK